MYLSSPVIRFAILSSPSSEVKGGKGSSDAYDDEIKKGIKEGGRRIS